MTVQKRVDNARAVTEITLYTADHPGLFSRIAGALAVSGANIVDAKIMTMSNGMALDTLWVQDQDNTPFDRPDKRPLQRASRRRLRVDEGALPLDHRPQMLGRGRSAMEAPRVATARSPRFASRRWSRRSWTARSS